MCKTLSSKRLWRSRRWLALSALLTMGCAWSRNQQGDAPAVGSTLPRYPSRSARVAPPREPAAQYRTIGRSVQGRPIEAIRLGSGPGRVLMIGSVHGDEPEGVHLAERFVTHVQQNPAAISGFTVMVVRDANPDGYRSRSRTNARGVDLNRNFPASNWQRGKSASGAKPASEPETQAILAVLREFQPHRIVAMHSTRGAAMVNFDGPAESLAAAMARHNGYQVSDYIGYPTPGSLGSFLGRDGRLPIITLELPRGVDSARAWRDNREALIEAVRYGGRGGRPDRAPSLPATRPAA